MVRDFSREKREELYKALDTMDEREWKPFLEWCGGRAEEFGEWAERLGISSHMRQVDNFQDRILEVNDSARNQIDAVFEGVAEMDRRYAETFRGHVETVKGQIKRVQVMLQAMQSADGAGLDVKVLSHDRDPQPGVPREELVERGQRVLRSYLRVRGVTDPAEQQKVCGWIMERQPGMLVSLYLEDYHGDEGASTTYHSMMEHYAKHKMDITIEDLEGLDVGEKLDQKQKETFVACWNRLGQMGASKEQIIAAMANIRVESIFSATNAENRFGYKKLYDDDYEFQIEDHVGYGILQWAHKDRKGELLKFANDNNGSVYDLETQLDYFQYEMEVWQYKGKWKKFLEINDRDEAVKFFWDSIEITGASLLKEGHPEYDASLKVRRNHADKIAAWYEKTFEQGVGER